MLARVFFHFFWAIFTIKLGKMRFLAKMLAADQSDAKSFLCAHFLGKNAKRDPHKLYRGDFGGQKRGPKQAIFGHKKFVDCFFLPLVCVYVCVWENWFQKDSCVMFIPRKAGVGAEAAKLHKIIPARDACTKDVLCSEIINSQTNIVHVIMLTPMVRCFLGQKSELTWFGANMILYPKNWI